MSPLTPLVIMTVIGGSVLAWLFIPSAIELAHFKIADRDFDGAREILLRDEFKFIGKPPSVTHQILLATTWALEGERARAARILEKMLVDDPKLAGVRDMLEQLYAGEPITSMSFALSRVATSARDKPAIRRYRLTLADADGRIEDATTEILALNAAGQATPAELLRLGFWYASNGKFDEAITTLKHANEADTGVFNLAAQRTLVSLLVEQKQVEEAARIARSWYDSNSDERLMFAYWMVERGWSSLAGLFIGADNEVENLAVMAYGEFQRGERQLALKRFRQLASRITLEGRLVQFYASLAVQAKSQDDIDAVLPGLRTIAKTEQDDNYSHSLYVEALRQTGRDDELVEYWKNNETRKVPSESLHIEILRALISLKRYPEILSTLRPLAVERGSDWLSAYIEGARQENALEDLKSTLRQRISQPVVNDQEREQIAHLLLSLGNKKDALPIFMSLSEGKPPTSTPMRDVLFLLGPRPDSSAINWLVERAQKAPLSELGDWLRYVLESGAAARVVSFVEALNKPWPSAVRRVYLESLVSLQACPVLRGELVLALKDERSITELVKYTQWANSCGDSDLVASAWRSVLAVDPNNLDAQREMGLLAFRERDMVTAITMLTDVVSARPDRWDLGQVLADAMWEEKRYPEAKRIYRQVIDTMNKETFLTRQQRLTQAIVISRLGDQANARARFKALRMEAPGDANIVAEYASFLMSQGKFDDAVRVLDAQKSAELGLRHAR